MADDRAYRILVQYISESEAYQARSPELGVEAQGPTRAEAMAAVESAIEEMFEKAAVDGQKLPRPADLAEESVELTLPLSAPVWRDLEVHARAQGLEPDALALQLLARSLGQLEGRPSRRPRKEAPAKASGEGASSEEDAPKPEKKESKGRRRGRSGRRGEGYRPEMENQADFLAYVRDQERGGRGRR